MTFSVPKRVYAIGDRVWCSPSPVDAKVVQDHLIRHVLGTGSLLAREGLPRPRPWNHEGWDQLAPPVIDTRERARLVSEIVGLRVDGQRCAVERLTNTEYAGESPEDIQYCVKCPARLMQECVRRCRTVREAYLDVIDMQLGRLVDEPAFIEEAEVFSKVVRLVRAARTDLLSDGLVLRFGFGGTDNGVKIGRLTSGLGVVVEFWASWKQHDDHACLRRWRTTYRSVQGRAAQQASFLLRSPRHLGDAPAVCWVPGPWWDQVCDATS